MAKRMTRRVGPALVVALALALIGAACTDDTAPAGREPGEAAPARLELSETHVRPGQLINLRVIAPGEHIYGIDAIIEHPGADGQWAPAYHTMLAVSADPAAFPVSTGYARYGDESWVVPLIAHSGDRWWTIALPKELKPGRYRIAMDVGLGKKDIRTVAYSEELVVLFVTA